VKNRRTFAFSIIAMASVALLGILSWLPTFWSSAIVILYSEGAITFEAATVDLAALLGSSSLAVALLSEVTVGDVLGAAAATALVDTTLLAWLGPWALVVLAAVIVTVV
jgi:hypothetical protein